MAGVPTQNTYLDDYSYSQQPIRETSVEEFGDWESDMGDESYGNSQSSNYDGTGDPKAELNGLQQRVQASGLNADQQQELLQELNALAAMPDSEMQGEQLSDLESAVEAKIENRDNLNESADRLKELRATISADPELEDDQRKSLLKNLDDFEKAQAEDPSLKIEDELGEVLGLTEQHADRAEAKKKEAERSKNIGAGIAYGLDQVFQAPAKPGEDGISWGDAAAGVAVGAATGGAIGMTSLTVAGYAISALGGPVAWGIGGAVLTAYLVCSETDAPKSKLNQLPAPFQKLDLAMHGESKLDKSPAPGDLARALYNTDLSGPELKAAIDKALAGLPAASKAMVTGLVINTIQDNDPAKLEYLKKNSPEILGDLSKVIQDGQATIKNGELSSTGHDDYDVSFNGVDYSVTNQDTHWYRNDWNDFSIPSGEILEPMSTALRQLQDGTAGLDSAAPTTVPNAA